MKKRYSIGYDEMMKNRRLEDFNIVDGADLEAERKSTTEPSVTPTGKPVAVDGKRVVFFERCEIRRPYYDNARKPTTTDNKTWNLGLFVVFKDREGREYVWMPRWDDVESIQDNKVLVEHKNKEKAREHLSRG